MLDYKAPVEDILFALEHGAGASRLSNWDGELSAEVIRQAARFIDNEVATLEPLADHSPAMLVDGRVKVAPELIAASKALTEGGWIGLSLPEKCGAKVCPGF